MNDSGVPPTSPEGAPAPPVGLPPRPGPADVDAVPAAPTATLTGGDESDGDDFWDDGPPAPESPQQGLHQRLRTIVEWVAVAVGALAVALLIKAFLLQAFYIPSGSMEPTLHKDDRVLVNKLSYRFGEPHHGDVVVFAKPESAPGNIDDFIKRVVALPGETISFVDGTVFIDGRAIEESYVVGTETNSGSPIRGCDNEPAADTCKVPEGMVFVMGDNRPGSQDSRVFGPIEVDSIIGRAFLKVWPLGDLGFL